MDTGWLMTFSVLATGGFGYLCYREVATSLRETQDAFG